MCEKETQIIYTDKNGKELYLTIDEYIKIRDKEMEEECDFTIYDMLNKTDKYKKSKKKANMFKEG